MTQENSIEKSPAVKREIRVVTDDGAFANLLDTARFEHMYRVANLFAESTMVPEHYRKNPGNCFIAVQMAVRLGVDPFMFMQKSYIVHGKPGMEAQLAIALINTSGLFENSIDYELQGDDPDEPHDPSYRVRAWAVRKATGKVVYGPWVDWKLVKAEGWDAKAGSKWLTMPGLMFMYRAATFFGRMHCPERLMGMSTSDELEDIGVSRGMIDAVSLPSIAPKPNPKYVAAIESSEPSHEAGAAAPTSAPAPKSSPGTASTVKESGDIGVVIASPVPAPPGDSGGPQAKRGGRPQLMQEGA